jgi:hypothetical protein
LGHLSPADAEDLGYFGEAEQRVPPGADCGPRGNLSGGGEQFRCLAYQSIGLLLGGPELA